MPEPFKEVYDLPDNSGQITSLVLDKEEFNGLCDDLREIMEKIHVDVPQEVIDKQVDALKAAMTVPLITRGNSTEPIFERYAITTDKMCVIVRGEGQRVFGQLVGQERIRQILRDPPG